MLFFAVRSLHKMTLLVGTSEVNFVAWVRWQNVGTYPWQFLTRSCYFKAPYRPLSGKVTVYSCRGDPKLRFAWSYIKIGQVLRSEMKKMWNKLQMLVSPKLDKISKFQVHIWNQQQILHLRACSHCMTFRWFKFTLKPPYSIPSESFLSAIWDTSLGLKTAWDISYDILWSLLKFVNIWQLQGHSSILAKIECLQKIKFFLMKERQGFDTAWGF